MLRTKFVLSALAAALVALPAAYANAWGRDGHAIVGLLAEREIDPATLEQVEALLDGRSIAEVASWADAVRPQDDYRWSAPLHYVNMPPEASAYQHRRDCPDVGCVVSAVDRFAREVADTSLPTIQRRESLMFLIHFVGDLHQPLHGGRKADRGGNDITITFFGTETNLHRAWDSQILRAHDPSPWPVIAEKLAATIDDHDRAAWLADYHGGNLIDTAGRWAFESHSLAERYCYAVVQDGDALEQPYVDATADIVELRLAQGGVRLAAVLETAFADIASEADASGPTGQTSPQTEGDH
ncbi:MAG: S1/P1 nuclease [Planctomycetota bacterium]